jgi:hypothetical protein
MREERPRRKGAHIMKYDTKEKLRLRMDELFAKNEEMIKERIASEAIDNG